jgi:hypothetical protein
MKSDVQVVSAVVPYVRQHMFPRRFLYTARRACLMELVTDRCVCLTYRVLSSRTDLSLTIDILPIVAQVSRLVYNKRK